MNFDCNKSQQGGTIRGNTPPALRSGLGQGFSQGGTIPPGNNTLPFGFGQGFSQGVAFSQGFSQGFSLGYSQGFSQGFSQGGTIPPGNNTPPFGVQGFFQGAWNSENISSRANKTSTTPVRKKAPFKKKAPTKPMTAEERAKKRERDRVHRARKKALGGIAVTKVKLPPLSPKVQVAPLDPSKLFARNELKPPPTPNERPASKTSV